MGDVDELLRDQMAYYRAVAGEYDQAYESHEDLRSLDALAQGLPIDGEVLELACGTGQWTRFPGDAGASGYRGGRCSGDVGRGQGPRRRSGRGVRSG